MIRGSMKPEGGREDPYKDPDRTRTHTERHVAMWLPCFSGRLFLPFSISILFFLPFLPSSPSVELGR